MLKYLKNFIKNGKNSQKNLTYPTARPENMKRNRKYDLKISLEDFNDEKYCSRNELELRINKDGSSVLYYKSSLKSQQIFLYPSQLKALKEVLTNERLN